MAKNVSLFGITVFGQYLTHIFIIILIFKHTFIVLKDQRNLGMSMKIERSSLDQVKKRFEINKKKMEEKKKEYDFEERLKELKEEVCH